MALGATAKEFIQKMENGDNIYRRKTIDELLQGVNIGFFQYNGKEFAEELVKAYPFIVQYYGKIPGTENLKDDEEMWLLAINKNVNVSSELNDELRNKEPFKSIVEEKEQLQENIRELQSQFYPAFRAQKIKLKDVHYSIFATGGEVSRYLAVAKERIILYFDEKTKDLAETDMVETKVEEKIAQQLDKLKQTIDEKREQQKNSKYPISIEEFKNLENELKQTIQTAQVNQVLEGLDKLGEE